MQGPYGIKYSHVCKEAWTSTDYMQFERSMIKHDNIIEQSNEEEDIINEKRPSTVNKY